jgi:acetolactate synthase-1/2/3 large subunit
MRQIEGFAERFGCVGVAWRRLECFDNGHPNFAGHVGWGWAMRCASGFTKRIW